MKTRLFTTFYAEPNEGRHNELLACLDMNIGSFDEVCILYEGAEMGFPFVTERRIDRRQKYSDLLAWAAEVATDDDICVLANCDVMIPRTLTRSLHWNLGPDDAWALTRWDCISTGVQRFLSQSSQDTWALRGKPRDIGGDYCFGHPGCDNRFAHELDAAGYRVLNPSKTFRTYHLHASGHRTSNKPENRVPLPYLFVSPHELGEQPEYHRPTWISRRASSFQL